LVSGRRDGERGACTEKRGLDQAQIRGRGGRAIIRLKRPQKSLPKKEMSELSKERQEVSLLSFLKGFLKRIRRDKGPTQQRALQRGGEGGWRDASKGGTSVGWDGAWIPSSSKGGDKI